MVGSSFASLARLTAVLGNMVQTEQCVVMTPSDNVSFKGFGVHSKSKLYY